MDIKKLKNIRNTNAWKAAEWDYSEIWTSYTMPLLGPPPTSEQMNSQMIEILQTCPQFFPAILHRGQYYIDKGKDELAGELYDHGFDLMLVIAQEDEMEETMNNIIEFLENELRYDMCCKFLNRLIKLFPKNALYYDLLAGDVARSQNGDIEQAITIQAKAIELEPMNTAFLSNHAWLNLIAGKLNEAETNLKKARAIEPDDKFVKGNTEILEYLKQKKGSRTFWDYLLRPLNRERMQQLKDDENYDKLESLCSLYNIDRIEVFKHALLKDGKYSPYLVSNSSKTLNTFFRFVSQIINSSDFLYEDINNFIYHFEPIMHKFIFKHGDIDDEIFDDVYFSLITFYDFLCQNKLVDKGDYEEFLEEVNGMKVKLRKKMYRYNEIRHDDNISDEEKEEIRQELFKGDHEWPFL